MALGTSGRFSLYVWDISASEWVNYSENLLAIQSIEETNTLKGFSATLIAITSATQKADVIKDNVCVIYAGTTLIGKYVIGQPSYQTDTSVKISGYVSTGSKIHTDDILINAITRDELREDDDVDFIMTQSAPTQYGLILNDAGDQMIAADIDATLGAIKLTLKLNYEKKLKVINRIVDKVNGEWWIATTGISDSPHSVGTDKVYLYPTKGTASPSQYTLNMNGASANCIGTQNNNESGSMCNRVVILGNGAGVNQLKVENFHATDNRTHLNGNLDSYLSTTVDDDDTTITVSDSSKFASPSGKIRIGDEYITYTGNTGTSFTTCTRGASSSLATAHKAGVDVLNYGTNGTDIVVPVDSVASFPVPSSGDIFVGSESISYGSVSGSNFVACQRGSDPYTHLDDTEVYDAQYTVTSPEGGSKINTHGLFSKSLTDNTSTKRDELDKRAEYYRDHYDDEVKRIEVVVGDPFDVLDNVVLGDTITVTDSQTDLSGDYRIHGLTAGWNLGEVTVKLYLSNRKLEYSEELKEGLDVDYQQAARSLADNIAEYSKWDGKTYTTTANKSIFKSSSSMEKYLEFSQYLSGANEIIRLKTSSDIDEFNIYATSGDIGLAAILGDIDLLVGDAAGAKSINFKDSGNNTICKVDSNGVLTVGPTGKVLISSSDNSTLLHSTSTNAGGDGQFYIQHGAQANSENALVSLNGVGDANKIFSICGYGLNDLDEIRLKATFTRVNQLKSIVAIGTKPLDVTSTTVCTNLNADMLDGLHANEIGGAPSAAQYVTLALDGTLSAERVLTAGEGIDLTDGGANGTIIILGENATHTNRGIASFAVADFSISNGAVDIKYADMNSALIPSDTQTLDLGSSTKYWRFAYLEQIYTQSTTLVTNLNADMIDGLHASSFVANPMVADLDLGTHAILGVTTFTGNNQIKTDGALADYIGYFKNTNPSGKIMYMYGYEGVKIDHVGTTQVNGALYIDSATITSGNLIQLKQRTSSFAGNVVYVNMGDADSTKFTGNFLHFELQGTDKFRVNYLGEVASLSYLNFTSTAGANGCGVRYNSGKVQCAHTVTDWKTVINNQWDEDHLDIYSSKHLRLYSDAGTTYASRLSDDSGSGELTLYDNSNADYARIIFSTDLLINTISGDILLDPLDHVVVYRENTATAGNTYYSSNTLEFQGSYWDGSVAHELNMAIKNHVSSATPAYGLLTYNHSAQVVSSINNSGDFKVYYPSDSADWIGLKNDGTSAYIISPLQDMYFQSNGNDFMFTRYSSQADINVLIGSAGGGTNRTHDGLLRVLGSGSSSLSSNYLDVRFESLNGTNTPCISVDYSRLALTGDDSAKFYVEVCADLDLSTIGNHSAIRLWAIGGDIALGAGQKKYLMMGTNISGAYTYGEIYMGDDMDQLFITANHDLLLTSLNENVTVKLGDALGVKQFAIQDSGGNEQFAVDSDGNVTYSGTHPAADGFNVDGTLNYDMNKPTLQETIKDLYYLIEILSKKIYKNGT